jgi:hypothetical protein
MRRRWIAICVFAGLVFGWLSSFAAGEAAPSGSEILLADAMKPASTEKSDPKSSSTGRLREGSKLVDQIGEFQKSGERINFFSKDGHGVLRVLENLALERVGRVLDDNPATRDWSVSGVVTEFRGENYLLLTRAVLKARTDSGNAPRTGQRIQKE